MKIFVEVEVLPAEGWRYLTPDEMQGYGIDDLCITDAPYTKNVNECEEEYSIHLMSSKYMSKEVGGWIRDGWTNDPSDPPVKLGEITHYDTVGTI